MSNYKEGNTNVIKKEKTKYQILPPDIMMEILIWTDIESLPRLRWVCKEWRRLMSHPQFINRHHQKAKSICGFVLDRTSFDKEIACQIYETYFFPHPSPQLSEPDLPSLTFMSEPVHIKASTPNGLLLCFGLFNKCYYVCKPTTQEWSAIPSPDPEKDIAKFAMSVASTSPLRFRVMVISRYLKKYHCEVFDSDSSGMWKTIDCAAPFLEDKRFINLSFRWGLVLNGSFLWIKQVGDYKYTKIICVDLWKEEGSTLELPREVTDGNLEFHNRLSNLRGGLGLVGHQSGTLNIHIWAMSGSVVEQKWEKLHVLELENGLICFSAAFGWIRSEFILDNHVLINPKKNRNEIFWYNCQENKYISTNKRIFFLDCGRLVFFQSDYFPCNIDECPYNNFI